MDMNKVLNDDCAAVAQKFVGQIIGPTILQRDMHFGYNRAARTIEGLVAKGMAVHTVATGSYACKVNALPAETEYSDTETSEPTAADYRQLQLMYDQLQTELHEAKAREKKLIEKVGDYDREIGGVIDQRDLYHDWADKLANEIARYFGVNIGEHSSANNPWAAAFESVPVECKAELTKAAIIEAIEATKTRVEVARYASMFDCCGVAALYDYASKVGKG